MRFLISVQGGAFAVLDFFVEQCQKLIEFKSWVLVRRTCFSVRKNFWNGIFQTLTMCVGVLISCCICGSRLRLCDAKKDAKRQGLSINFRNKSTYFLHSFDDFFLKTNVMFALCRVLQRSGNFRSKFSWSHFLQKTLKIFYGYLP